MGGGQSRGSAIQRPEVKKLLAYWVSEARASQIMDGRISCALAGGDGIGARATPEAAMDGVGEAVRGAAEVALVRGVVALAAEAVARPKTACEYGGKNALLVRAERTRLQHAHDWFTENAALVL